MNFPAGFISSLSGLPGFDRAAFCQVHDEAAPPVSVRLNPLKKAGQIGPFLPATLLPVPWAANAFYLPERPSFTFDPVFHAGGYYVQEASSMFIAQAIGQLLSGRSGVQVLDLCASPGGKSTHLVSLLDPGSLLVSNEVIRSRALVLKDNLMKWGYPNTIVTNNDPADFQQLPGFFDVLLVDAPCSGSGLFRREPDAMDEWSLNNVQLCSKRQQRILADSWDTLKTGGLLIYSTCSYSAEEDEAIMDWIVAELGAENLCLQTEPGWQVIPGVTPSGNTGYRFWPDKVRGEGFFMACFCKTKPDTAKKIKAGKKTESLSQTEKNTVAGWLNPEQFYLFKHAQTVYAWPGEHVAAMTVMLERTRLVSSGIKVGELMRDKLVPDHGLAMSAFVAANVPRAELDLQAAIRYLQRRDMEQPPVGKGWTLATFQDMPLGWMNILPGRINNYYPKELRILKES